MRGESVFVFGDVSFLFAHLTLFFGDLFWCEQTWCCCWETVLFCWTPDFAVWKPDFGACTFDVGAWRRYVRIKAPEFDVCEYLGISSRYVSGWILYLGGSRPDVDMFDILAWVHGDQIDMFRNPNVVFVNHNLAFGDFGFMFEDLVWVFKRLCFGVETSSWC